MNVHSFPLGEKIIAMTLIDQQLYLLRERKCEEIDVYSTVDYRLLRRINLDNLNKIGIVSWPEGGKSYQDMASCPVKKCLYLISQSSVVHRIDLLGNITQCTISTNFYVYGISVAQNCNLLVSGRSCSENPCIVEWDWKASKIIRQVELIFKDQRQPSYFLFRPLQFSNCDAVVYYGSYRHRVSLVSVSQDGRPTSVCETNFYGHESASYTVGRLSSPSHMDVDPDTGSIFVADSGDHRVVLLSRSLLFLRSIKDGIQGRWIKRVCFDNVTRCLFVGMEGENGGVLKALKFCRVVHEK